MESRECHRWTLWGLVVAFLELAIAYCLLCGSAFAFLASKFLLAFGLYIPCPCSGILGYKNKDFCLRRLLFEWPLRKVYSIQKLATSRLPCEIVWHQEQEEIPSSATVSADGKHGNDGLKMVYRKGSSSASGLRIKNSADRESDSDVKARQIMNQKQKVTGRRRRGKSSLVFLRGNAQGSANDTQVMRTEISEGSGAVDNTIQDEFNLKGPTSCCGDKVHVADGETDETREDSSSVKAQMHNDVDTIKKLEQALGEEKAARAALFLELEEERAAAATAADEAMAMILRLQADKASLEMEAKQYERMMEEKFAYDEEEMTILKEILVRREKENHFLEKELEAYKQIDIPDDEFAEDGFNEHDYPHGHIDFGIVASSEGREISQDDLSMCQRAQTRNPVEKGLSFCDADVEKIKEAEAKMNSHEDGSLPEKESIIYDVHVVEDNTESHEGKTKEYEKDEGSVNSVEYKDKETARMKLMEEIVNQLREIVKDHDNVSSPSSSAVNPSGHLSKSTKEAIQNRGCRN